MIDVLVDYAPRRSSPLSYVSLTRLDDAYCEVDDDATAFAGGRTPRYVAFMTGMCATREMAADERVWLRSLYAALKPHRIGEEAHVNMPP